MILVSTVWEGTQTRRRQATDEDVSPQSQGQVPAAGLRAAAEGLPRTPLHASTGMLGLHTLTEPYLWASSLP